MELKRHVCPCNCYSNCCIISHVKNDKVQGIMGDPLHKYTKGYLCSKMLDFLDIFYHQERVLYPMRQVPRGSGNWEVISWDDAFKFIANKILNIKNKYDSFLPLFILKGSGNIGLLHDAWKWFAQSLQGGSTINSGTICWNALVDGYHDTFGDFFPSDPETMENCEVIVLWGVNPAWTAMHQMNYIQKARAKGAKVIVIDPILTVTASKADYYFQIHPNSDGALALAMAYYLISIHKLDMHFLTDQVENWQEFYAYVKGLNPLELADMTGLTYESIIKLTELYADSASSAMWIGLGMQRYTNGGNVVKTILAVQALTGHLKSKKVFFPNTKIADLFVTHWEWMYSEKNLRVLPTYQLGKALLEVKEPKIKMAIIAAANPLTQLAESEKIEKALAGIETVVVADHFLNETSHWADIFLPTTTWLEHWDVVPGYWHNWLGINQPAIRPRGDCLSDIQIITNLVQYLNNIEPDMSTFPIMKEEEWLDKVFSKEVYNLLRIDHYSELLQGPRHFRPQKNNKFFNTSSGKMNIISPKNANECLSLNKNRRENELFPYRLLTPHSNNMLNSQFGNIEQKAYSYVYINPQVAKYKRLRSGDSVRIYNDLGEKQVKVIINDGVAPGVIVYYQNCKGDNINRLIKPIPTDLGQTYCKEKGLAIYETFVDIAPLRNV